jgi:CheY-like chemotaxis protein
MVLPVQQKQFAVLVVEDNPLLLADAMDLAGDAGLMAYGASNADQAIRLLETHSDIKILFTDIDMPGTMDGLKLAHVVRGRWPPVTIIVTSGHIKVTKENMPENGIFVAKPYQPSFVTKTFNEIAAQITG